MYVDEGDRAWTSSSPANDHQAVTIEVANDGGAPDWHVSDIALAALIDLCVDICQRNGIEQLNYTGDSSGNLTRHNMFAATTCPGPYLESKFPYIVDEVNKRLGATPEASIADTAPAASDSGDSTSTAYSIIRKGSTGADVKTGQTLLNAKSANLGVDGDFGALTDTATRVFQAANGLTVDGVIGPDTWAALQSSDSQSIATASNVTRAMIQKGNKGSDVTYLQTTLNAKGYDCGTVDGDFGANTDAAVRAFQRDNGLDVDGIVGPKTWAKLQ